MSENPTAGVRCAGFTVLESMVAMVIFAGAALALYGLFNTNLIAMGRAHDVSRQMTVARQALEHLATVNPREGETGRFHVEGVDVVWSARLLEPARQNRTVSGDRGHFEIGLYEIAFELHDAGRPLDTWRVRVPGYRKTREPVP